MKKGSCFGVTEADIRELLLPVLVARAAQKRESKRMESFTRLPFLRDFSIPSFLEP